MYTQMRVSDLKNKTAEQLRQLKEIGVNEISLGVESGDHPSHLVDALGSAERQQTGIVNG